MMKRVKAFNFIRVVCSTKLFIIWFPY